MRSWMVLMVLAAPVMVPAASAQSVAEPRSITATPFVGLSFGTGEGLGSSIGLGGAFGYDLTANLGFEAELGHTFDVSPDTDFVDWSLTNFSVNAIYHFDVIRVTPYATFGLGVERSALRLEGDVAPAIALIPSSTEIAYNFGGGVKYKLADRMLARADLRRFQANDFAPDFWRLYGGLTFVLRR